MFYFYFAPLTTKYHTMAKVKHANLVNLIDTHVSHGIDSNVLQLSTNKVISGRKLLIRNKEVIHFGNCNYLGLERHPKVLEASIAAIRQEGIRLTMSRTYVSSGYYVELEELLSKMYGGHVVVAPSSTMLHLSAIPVLFDSEDLILLDHQVHASMTQAVMYKKASGLTVKTIRHNRYDLLEDILKDNKSEKHQKIWYVLDGIYSMYGDAPDMPALIKLLDKYPNFYIYVDDAHGCSWIGKNGRGYVLDQVDLHPKMMLTVSLGKGFGVIGGVLVTKNEEYCRKVRNCGNTLMFSAPLSSGLLGAAIASAKIHLTDEITTLQEDLQDKIRYANQLIREYHLPQIKEMDSPIFYIGTGSLKIAYQILDRLINDGYITNVGGFPAVPLRCAGIRFLLTCHLTKEDIKGLIERIAYHLPRVFQEENYTFKKLARAFKCPHFENLEEHFKIEENNIVPVDNGSTSNDYRIIKIGDTSLKVAQYDCISEMENIDEWNSVMDAKGPYDKRSLEFVEKVFQGNEDAYNNWKFIYIQIRDSKDQLILAAYFTESLWKEDCLAPPSVSKELETIRAEEDPDYLISKSISLGCQAFEGKPFYLNRAHENKNEALDLLVNTLMQEEEKRGTEIIVIRDMHEEDNDLKTFFLDKGFLLTEMPNRNLVENMSWKDEEGFLESIKDSKNNKIHFRKNIKRHLHMFEVSKMEQADSVELDRIHELYLNVKDVNFGLNTFPLPKHFFSNILSDETFDLIKIELKPEFSETNEKKIIGFFCGKKVGAYYEGMYLGMDYDYLHSHGIYRQILYQVLKWAGQSGCTTTHLGFSADIEKSKFGATANPTFAYMNFKDNFKQIVIQNMGANKLKKHY